MRIYVVALLFLSLLGSALSAQAGVIDLKITASWNATDYDVSSTGPDSPLGIPEENDDKVFGISPSAGSTTFTLRVDTSSAVFYASGYNGITHDWYGYSDVSLVGTHTFGSASWETSDILTNLVGVDGVQKALWTDTDIAAVDPTRLSFRMFGDWEGRSADLFIGSRTTTTISKSFLMWEYYNGEEIRTSNTVTANSVSEPATLGILGLGLSLLCVARRKRSKQS